ncbi:hypothetical protein [Streptomyces sp. NPDC007883]|uniref:hypothetical protein n=1 Tax=Streptomyces sp. NPDC007883 TaxID=3155116 RepID=UPI00340878CE
MKNGTGGPPQGASLAARAACFGPCARDQYVGVPAADGNTYPLSWRAGPPAVGEFVDPELLFAVVAAQLCLSPEGRAGRP